MAVEPVIPLEKFPYPRYDNFILYFRRGMFGERFRMLPEYIA